MNCVICNQTFEKPQICDDNFFIQWVLNNSKDKETIDKYGLCTVYHIVPCNHYIHTECFKNHSKIKECPKCNTVIDSLVFSYKAKVNKI